MNPASLKSLSKNVVLNGFQNLGTGELQKLEPEIISDPSSVDYRGVKEMTLFRETKAHREELDKKGEMEYIEYLQKTGKRFIEDSLEHFSGREKSLREICDYTGELVQALFLI